MTAQVVRRQSSLWPGGGISYSIWVWSTVPSRAVTATASSRGSAAGPPRFSLCPAAHKRNCSIGDLSANQAIELLVTNHIGTTATTGEQVTLTVTVQGTGLSPAEAAVTAVVGAASPSPTTSSPPPITTPPLPPALPGPTVTPGSLNTLFPLVTPSPTPSATATKKSNGVTAATPTASTLPLDPRLIGGQLAGLAVLAAAVTLVVARLSLRPATPTGHSPRSGGADPAPDPPAADAADPPATDNGAADNEATDNEADES